jgi:hypothetical protein
MLIRFIGIEITVVGVKKKVLKPVYFLKELYIKYQ